MVRYLTKPLKFCIATLNIKDLSIYQLTEESLLIIDVLVYIIIKLILISNWYIVSPNIFVFIQFVFIVAIMTNVVSD